MCFVYYFIYLPRFLEYWGVVFRNFEWLLFFFFFVIDDTLNCCWQLFLLDNAGVSR